MAHTHAAALQYLPLSELVAAYSLNLFRANVDLQLQQTVTRHIKLQGSCPSSGEYQDCLKMIVEDRILVVPIVNAVAPLL